MLHSSAIRGVESEPSVLQSVHGAIVCILASLCSKFLARLPSLLVANGIVIFISPYSWLPQYTDKSKWIGGFTDETGVEHDSRVGLMASMTALGFLVSVTHSRSYVSCNECRI